MDKKQDNIENNQQDENQKNKKIKKQNFLDFLKQAVSNGQISKEEVDQIIMFAKKELGKFLLNDIRLNNSLVQTLPMKNLLSKYINNKNTP